MKKIFQETNSLDNSSYKTYKLSEDILMEQAANAINIFIRKKFKKNSKILIIVGSGNNGGDGFALARLLHKDYKVKILVHKKAKSNMAIKQKLRADSIKINYTKKIKSSYAVVVDAIFGTGLNKSLRSKTKSLIAKLNKLKALKIACDIPSGIMPNDDFKNSFKADLTFTMGALKLSCFSDKAKDFVGKIKIVNLGLSSKIYQNKKTNYNLLEKKDMALPLRKIQNVNKGTFGHLAIISGDKIGASIIAAKAALSFGTGLVSIISKKNLPVPFDIINTNKLAKNTKSILLGCGLGSEFKEEELKNLLKNKDLPLVLDADIFYKKIFKKLLRRKKIVLSPHPKEFVHILKKLNIADIDIKTLQKNRFLYALKFSKKYKNAVLVLKGANTIIAKKKKVYINSFGNSSLARGGTGDILAGLISSLLSQGYKTLKACISASLAQSLAAKKVKKNSYGISINEIIKKISCL